MDPSLRISIRCDVETKTAFEGFVANHTEEIDKHRSVQSQNLDGNTAAWIVIATLSAQVIPHLLTFLSEARKSGRVGRLKIGDVEIDNPSEEDLRLVRQMMRERLGTDDDHDDAASAG